MSFNIQLKDDKTYPWICIKNEAFPRVFSTRKLIKDGSSYYGPYPGVFVINTLLELIREIYPLRNCALNLAKKNVEEGKYKVCLEYHLGNCRGPCVGEESEENYAAYIKEIEHILKGNISQVVRLLKERMTSASEALQFELANELKTKIATIERFQSKSTVVSSTVGKVDVITVLHEEKCAYVNYLMVVNGAIVHGITVEVEKKLEESSADIQFPD